MDAYLSKPVSVLPNLDCNFIYEFHPHSFSSRFCPGLMSPSVCFVLQLDSKKLKSLLSSYSD